MTVNERASVATKQAEDSAVTRNAIAVCGETTASCLCVLAPGHKDLHECECDGSWLDDGTNFIIGRLPVGEGARSERLAATTLTDGQAGEE